MKVNTIDTRVGTYNDRFYSNGNTLPLTANPFGMNYFSMQTDNEREDWFFNPRKPIFQGIRLTHQPSPWMGDYSYALITPTTASVTSTDIERIQSSYNTKTAVFQPNYFKADLFRYGMTTELSPTKRGAKLRLTNRELQDISLMITTEFGSEYEVDSENNRVEIKISQPVNDDKAILNMYMIMEFNESEVKNISVDKLSGKVGAINLQTLSEVIEISLATSFISTEQSLLNLKSEVLDHSFDEVVEKSAEKWNSYLEKIEVEDTDKEKVENFNHYLYRAFLFPQTFYEINENDEPIHYDVYSETVAKGKFFTNNGYWDTFRTVYPLFSLLIPEKYQDILEGIQHFYNESGHLPKWLSPDERGLMPGTLVNGVLADAAVKNLLTEEQEEFFLDAMIKESTTPPKEGKFGRAGVEDMLEYGYVTNDHIESVNQTQDNAYSDFCISQLAKKLNKKSIADQFDQEALNYRNIFDEETGFMRGKDKDGNFTKDFRPEDWSADYTEGSAWQNSLAVYHNYSDLIDMFGGKEKFLDHLLNLANEEPTYDVGNYGMEIHEMSEHAVSQFGQIAISNQPSFHIPYLFVYADKPEYTQLLIRQILKRAFTNDFEGFPGDEDNGSMSAWYIFSSLGFYPVTPGTTEYVMGIPQFDQVTLYLPNNKEFTISAANNEPQNQFNKKVMLNGESYEKLYIDHNDIMSGGNLFFELGVLPPIKEYSDEQLPYSLSTE